MIRLPTLCRVRGMVFLSCERHYRRETPVRHGIVVLSPVGKI